MRRDDAGEGNQPDLRDFPEKISKDPSVVFKPILR
jgi:hypothetical protein